MSFRNTIRRVMTIGGVTVLSAASLTLIAKPSADAAVAWKSRAHPLHVHSDSGTDHGSAYGTFTRTGDHSERHRAYYKDNKSDGHAVWVEFTTGTGRPGWRHFPRTQSSAWQNKSTSFWVSGGKLTDFSQVLLRHEVSFAPDDYSDVNVHFH